MLRLEEPVSSVVVTGLPIDGPRFDPHHWSGCTVADIGQLLHSVPSVSANYLH